jgi:flagellar FliL protein
MAAPAAPDVTDESVEAAPPRKSKKKLFLIIGTLMVLLAGSGASAWLLMKGKDHSPSKAEVAPLKPPVFLALETFTVNLQGGEQYLQTDITLQVADLAQVDALKQHMPRIRSRLLTLLSSKHADELINPEDKEKLAQEIQAQVAQPLQATGKPQQVEDVLFTSFVIQ